MQHFVGHGEGLGEGGAVIGDAEQILVWDDDQGVDEFLQLFDAGFGDAHAVTAFEMKRLSHDTDSQDPRFARDSRDHGSTPRAGATTHPGGDENHIGAAHRLEDVIERFLCRSAADIGPRPGAEPPGDSDPQLNLALCARLQQRLRVGVADYELAPDQIRADHVVDGVSPGAAHPDHRDAGFHLVLVLWDAQVDHAVVPHKSCLYDPRSDRSGLPPRWLTRARASNNVEFASKVLLQPVTQSTEDPAPCACSAAPHTGHLGALR